MATAATATHLHVPSNLHPRVDSVDSAFTVRDVFSFRGFPDTKHRDGYGGVPIHFHIVLLGDRLNRMKVWCFDGGTDFWSRGATEL